MKLRFVITFLFVLMLFQIIIVLLIPDNINEYIEAYDSLTYDEQSIVDKYVARLPVEDDNIYSLIGILNWMVLIGLGILTYKLWYVKEI